jgi:hypothetical protein
VTKAIVCMNCVDLRMLRPEGPVSCHCGNVTGEWVDAGAGTCRITARELSRSALMGLSNGFLTPGLRAITMGMRDDFTPEASQWWRDLHAEAAKAPGYFFDETRRSCWAILMGPFDSVSGVEWVEAVSEPLPK